MTMIKRRSVLLPSALLLVGALATIWWFVAVRDQGAAELLYGACQDISQDESYDYSFRFTGPHWHGADPDIRPVGTFLGSTSVAGGDVYSEMNYQEDPQKSYRVMVVDDVVVYRLWGRVGRWSQFTDLSPDYARREVAAILTIKPNSLCPPDGAQIIGTAEHEGVTVQHLRFFSKHTLQEGMYGIIEQTVDYWVGPMGRVVKVKHHYLFDDLTMGLVRFDKEVVVSGVGETNTIIPPEDYKVITRP